MRPLSAGFPRELRGWLDGRPWIWSFVAAFGVWLVVVAVTQRGVLGTLVAAAQVAPFLVLVGIGQTFVVTGGNGNIDLSIPSVMTVAGYVGLGVMDGRDQLLIAGLVVALGCGAASAVLSLVSVLVLRIPPIIATLATGFVLQTAAYLESAGHFSARPSPALVGLVGGGVAGVPLLAIFAVAVAGAGALVLHATGYGRTVQAAGQSVRAARLSGVNVPWSVARSYLLSGLLAALAGLLLAAYNQGTSLDIASPYLLNSIAVVVLGGSLIGGGRSTIVGIWGAALLLSLLLTMLNVIRVSVAWQDIIQGLVIVGVLAFVGSGRER